MVSLFQNTIQTIKNISKERGKIMQKKPTVIMISNNKGGVGKTTTTIELSAALARREKKVLAIDMDPQGNLTSYVGLKIGDDYNLRDVLNNMHDYALAECELIGNKACKPTSENFDVVCGNKLLVKSMIEFSEIGDEFCLKDYIDSIEGYDYILLDCAPSKSQLYNMALLAADYCVIVTESDPGSLDGIMEIIKDIILLSRSGKPAPSILGALLTKDKMAKAQRKAYDKINDEYGATYGVYPFTTTIPDGIAATDAKEMKMSIYAYMEQGNREEKRKAKAIAKSYEQLTDEILERITIFEQN